MKRRTPFILSPIVAATLLAQVPDTVRWAYLSRRGPGIVQIPDRLYPREDRLISGGDRRLDPSAHRTDMGSRYRQRRLDVAPCGSAVPVQTTWLLQPVDAAVNSLGLCDYRLGVRLQTLPLPSAERYLTGACCETVDRAPRRGDSCPCREARRSHWDQSKLDSDAFSVHSESSKGTPSEFTL